MLKRIELTPFVLHIYGTFEVLTWNYSANDSWCVLTILDLSSLPLSFDITGIKTTRIAEPL